MCVYVAITFITRLWLFNSSFRTFIHSFVHALLFIVTRYTIRSLPSGIYNSPDFFFQFYTDRFLLVSFLLRNFSSTIVHKLANCYYCCYTTNVRKSFPAWCIEIADIVARNKFPGVGRTCCVSLFDGHGRGGLENPEFENVRCSPGIRSI